MSEHIRGNPNAGTVLVEYADFECPYCAMAYPYVKRLSLQHGKEMADVFRPFPLPQIHPHSMHAAQAAEAAGKQGKFWEMHDLLFENRQRLDDKSLLEYAERLKLNIPQFEKDFASRATIEAIEHSYERGIREGVQGTPTFFLNGEQLQIESYEDLESDVEEALH